MHCGKRNCLGKSQWIGRWRELSCLSICKLRYCALDSTNQRKDGLLTPTIRINDMAKVELSQRVGGKGVKIEYRLDMEPEMVRKEGKTLYDIGAYLTGWGFEGVRLGGGRGLNKVEAGNRAAMEALKSEVVEKAAVIKKDFDAKMREKRENAAKD